MVDRTELTQRRSGRLTLGEFVRGEFPHLLIASISQPEPEFARHNIVAATPDIDAARTAVLERRGRLSALRHFTRIGHVSNPQYHPIG